MKENQKAAMALHDQIACYLFLQLYYRQNFLLFNYVPDKDYLNASPTKGACHIVEEFSM
jgi:hypothetical protein